MDIRETTISKQSEYIKQLLKRNQQLEKALKDVTCERDNLEAINIVNSHRIDLLTKELKSYERRNMERRTTVRQ